MHHLEAVFRGLGGGGLNLPSQQTERIGAGDVDVVMLEDLSETSRAGFVAVRSSVVGTDFAPSLFVLFVWHC